MDQKNNTKLSIIKLRMKLKERRKQRKLVKPTAPRYDEVYFRGLEWLNKL